MESLGLALIIIAIGIFICLHLDGIEQAINRVARAVEELKKREGDNQ
jgi:hypothetical protein